MTTTGGPLVAGQAWERAAGQVGRYRVPLDEATVKLHDRIAQIETATFTQVRGCVSELALERGRGDWAQLMQNEFTVSAVTVPSLPIEIFSLPIDAYLAYGQWAQEHEPVARGYRLSMEKAAKADRVASIEQGAVMGALIERRMRCVARSRRSFDHERQRVGDEFDLRHLHTRLFRYIAIAEAAELTAGWAPEAESISLRLAAGSLRSAFHLWLEDTDLSLPCVRTLLEQTCVARTWRVKPQRARRVADGSGAGRSSARWISESGWRRASVLGKALGEFSHVSPRSRTSGARALLEEIQSADTPDKALTARGHALDSAAYLLASEVASRLGEIDRRLADGFRDEVTLLTADEHMAATEDLLKRSHALEDYDFGLPDFQDERAEPPPTVDGAQPSSRSV